MNVDRIYRYENGVEVRKDDIVTVETYIETVTGRVKSIDGITLELDLSKKHNAIVFTYKHEAIRDISVQE